MSFTVIARMVVNTTACVMVKSRPITLSTRPWHWQIPQRQLQAECLEMQRAILYTSMKDVGMSKEVIDEWRGRVLVDFVRLAHLLDLTFPHDHDAIGSCQCFLLVMGDKDAGNADVMHAGAAASEADGALVSSKRVCQSWCMRLAAAMASASYASARATTSASKPSITDLACFPEPPCDW